MSGNGQRAAPFETSSSRSKNKNSTQHPVLLRLGESSAVRPKKKSAPTHEKGRYRPRFELAGGSFFWPCGIPQRRDDNAGSVIKNRAWPKKPSSQPKNKIASTL